jgi:dolichyl-phosphate beta-glucosyltransferase
VVRRSRVASSAIHSSIAARADAVVENPARVRASLVTMISLIIPTLREDVTHALATLQEALGALDGRRFEILFVDDSDADHLEAVRQAIERAAPVPNVVSRLVEGPRSGKGAAVRKGVQEAQGEIIFLMDADLPVSLDHVGEFIERIEGGAEVVVGERPLDRRFATPMRWVLSHGLRVIQRAFVFHSTRFRDTQCGFKAFRGPLLREIAGLQTVDGGMYDLEYLYVALKRGARIETVTIRANAERGESRINVWKCLRRDPVDVARVKLYGIFGHYK